jgi:hypothetical protein
LIIRDLSKAEANARADVQTPQCEVCREPTQDGSPTLRRAPDSSLWSPEPFGRILAV